MENTDNRLTLNTFVFYPKENFIFKPFAINEDIGIDLYYHPKFYYENKLIEGVVCQGDECEICSIKKTFLSKQSDRAIIKTIFKQHKLPLSSYRNYNICMPIASYTENQKYLFYYGFLILHNYQLENYISYIMENDLYDISSVENKTLLKATDKSMHVEIIQNDFFSFIPDNITFFNMFLEILSDENKVINYLYNALKITHTIEAFEVYKHYITSLLDKY